MIRRRLIHVAALLLASCIAEPAVLEAPVTVWLDPAGDPQGPYPSDFYTVVDEGTATGRRLDFSRAKADALPMRGLFFDEGDLRVHRADLEALDGFSGFAPVFVPFSGSLRPDTVRPAQFTLVDLADGVTVPSMPVYLGGEGSWVLVYPRSVLRAKHRYALLIGAGLRDLAGRPLTPARAWPLEGEDLAQALAASGAPRDALLGAFAFPVQDTTGEAIAAARGVYDAPAPKPFNVSKLDARTIVGQFTVPDYRLDGVIPLTPGGAPAIVTTNTIAFELRLPANYATAPRPYPIAIWGHGLQGTRSSIPEVDDGAMIAIDAVEHGLRRTVASSDLVAFKFFDFFHLLTTRDNLRQTALDNVALARMIDELDAVLQAALGGGAWIDGAKIAYVGGSLGAIQGGVGVPLMQNVKASVMVVGGAGLSQAFEHGLFGLLAPNVLVGHSPVERAAFYAHVQTIFDRADGVNYLRHAVREPLPGYAPQNFFFANVIGDPLVPNPANETYMWAAGLELLAPVFSNRYGLTELPGPTAAGNVVVNGERRTAVAFEYNPPAEVAGLDRHGYMEDNESAIYQISHFFLTALSSGIGEVVQAR